MRRLQILQNFKINFTVFNFPVVKKKKKIIVWTQPYTENNIYILRKFKWPLLRTTNPALSRNLFVQCRLSCFLFCHRDLEILSFSDKYELTKSLPASVFRSSSDLFENMEPYLFNTRHNLLLCANKSLNRLNHVRSAVGARSRKLNKWCRKSTVASDGAEVYKLLRIRKYGK